MWMTHTKRITTVLRPLGLLKIPKVCMRYLPSIKRHTHFISCHLFMATQLEAATVQLEAAKGEQQQAEAWHGQLQATQAELATTAAATARLEDQLRHAEEELEAALGEAAETMQIGHTIKG